MLINCPKCGFSQPKDQYCASCGVNMMTFKPKIVWWKKIVTNPFVQVTAVFLLVFSSIFYIRQARRAELLARVEYLKGGPVMVNRNSGESRLESGEVNEASAMAAQDSASQAGTSPQPGAPAASGKISTFAAAGLAADSAKLSITANAGIRGPKVTVKYLEVDRNTVASWQAEMRSLGALKNFDGVSVGVVPQAAAKLSAKGVKVLQTSEHPAEVGTVEWFMGTHRGEDLENEIGLFSSLVLTEVTEGLIRGDFEMQRAFRDPRAAQSMERVSFGSSFEAGPGAGYLLMGVVPQRFVADLDEEAKADAALSNLFKSRPFQTRETDFSVLIEFEFPSAK